MKQKKPEGMVDPSKLTLENIGTEADPNCKKCYGRGWLGVDSVHKVIVVCPCITKRFPKTRVTDRRGRKLVSLTQTEGVEGEEGAQTKEASNQTKDATKGNLGENVGREVQLVGEGA